MKFNKRLLLLCFLSLLTACSASDDGTKTNPAKDASSSVDEQEEARGVKQAPLSQGPQLKDRL